MARKVRVSPAEFVEKWGRRLKAATPDIRAGVERVDVAPTQLAAAKADKMRQRILEAIDSGKWAAGLSRVSLEEWRDQMVNKGLGRIAAGVDAAGPKAESFASEFFPFLDRVLADIDKMPDVTLEDSIQRATEFIRRTSQFKRRGRT